METNISQLKKLIEVLEQSEQSHDMLSEMYKVAREHYDKSPDHRFDMSLKVGEKLVDISYTVPAAVFEMLVKISQESKEHVKKRIHDELHPVRQVETKERYGRN